MSVSGFKYDPSAFPNRILKHGTPLTLHNVMTSENWMLITGVTNFVNSKPANNVFINVAV